MKIIFRFLGGVFALFLVLIVIFFVWADSNGIWVDAQDIRGGTFAGDENDVSSDYVFVNPVDFQNQVKVTVIKSNAANGNVNIQLG